MSTHITVDEKWDLSIGTIVFGEHGRGMQITCRDRNGDTKYVEFPFRLFEKLIRAYRHLYTRNYVFGENYSLNNIEKIDEKGDTWCTICCLSKKPIEKQEE